MNNQKQNMSRERDEHLCWFHGKLSREKAEEIVRTGEEDGAFLVRESNTAIGDFVLNVLYQGEVCHYQIRRHGEDAFFSIDDKIKILHGLDSLVEFYQQSANGLATKLTSVIKKDLPPNDLRSHGCTNLLHRATKENNHTVVSELLKCGYRNVDAKNQDGQTAVHLAAIHGDETILKLLVNAGVNVNCMDSLGNTPLHYACRSKSTSLVRILIEAKANIQVRNIKTGYVPLHDASKYGNMEIVKELLQLNAPHLPRTNFGEFPIDLAKEAGHNPELVVFLSNYKPPPATTYKFQWYHGTLERQEAVKVLLEYSENMFKENNEKQTQVEDKVCTAMATANNNVDDNISRSSETVDDNGNTNMQSLSKSDASGTFLLRFSSRSGYVLTMLCNDTPKNFLIQQTAKNYLYIDEGPYLPSLEHLVQHFMLFSDGLPINLRYPVPPKPKPPLPLFSTMPRNSPKQTSRQDDGTLNLSNVQKTHQLLATPDDDAMNRVGIFDDDSSKLHEHQPINLKKKPKDKFEKLVFYTLSKRSPKKSSIIDSMSLRKNKKSKAQVAVASEVAQTATAATTDETYLKMENLKKAKELLKNLSFSTDFKELQLPALESQQQNQLDSFYNVPRNNSSIMSEEESLTNVPIIEVERKTEAEVEYFTMTDVAIEKERMTKCEMAEVGQRSAAVAENNFQTNPNGYIPTVDIRVFMDNNPNDENSKAALEASAAELREFSNHPERLDSIISTASNDSELFAFFNRQSSTISAASQSSEATVRSTRMNYFIPRDCIELDEILGEGEFGSVYKGCLIRRNSNDQQHNNEVRCTVAIKTLRDEHCRTNKQEFLREASVMIKLQHHCIVQLIGISKGETLMMVQEMVPLGSMLQFILNNKEKINRNYELKIWASQIACGMHYLESHHFVHRDLAARNILLASRNQAKISDFGLSRALGSGNDCYQATQGGKWPIKWYAPESYNNGYFSHASDVWSFGVTLWEMFSLGEAPYGDIRGVDAINLIESGQRLSKPNLCSDHVYAIMINCWNYKPKDRPTFRYLTDFFSKDPDYQNVVELIKTEHIS